MPEQSLEGLALSCHPLGENDRLLTLLSDEEGVVRLAVPGARRPRSSLAAAVPLSHLRLQVGGRSGLRRVRQLKVLRSYSGLAQQLEALAAAQALMELCLALVPSDAPSAGILGDLLMQLGRLDALVRERGWSVVNVDSVVVAERPKLKPHIEAMRAAIASRMDLEADQVGVKATTNEQLGPEGREEGISCHAVVLLQKP